MNPFVTCNTEKDAWPYVEGEWPPSWRPFVVSQYGFSDIPEGFQFCPLIRSSMSQPISQGVAAVPKNSEVWFDLPCDHPWWNLLRAYVSLQDIWEVRGITIDLKRPQIMGIWNVSPDSFSSVTEPIAADSVEHARELLARGADILDIGAESTRPGADHVSSELEIERLAPAIAWAQSQGIPVSLDTYKPEVMEWAADRVHIINDIGGEDLSPERDEKVFSIVKKHHLGYVMMAYWSHDHTFNTVGEALRAIVRQLDERMARAIGVGVDPRQIVLDPGIGFGKGLEVDLGLISQAAPALATLGRPVLIAHSRKRCLGLATSRSVEQRDIATAIGDTLAFQSGAKIVRVHDPAGAADARALLMHGAWQTSKC